MLWENTCINPSTSLNLFSKPRITKPKKTKKIFNDGYLGSHDDEERSEMRYAMRIAEFLESSDFRTQPAPSLVY